MIYVLTQIIMLHPPILYLLSLLLCIFDIGQTCILLPWFPLYQWNVHIRSPSVSCCWLSSFVHTLSLFFHIAIYTRFLVRIKRRCVRTHYGSNTSRTLKVLRSNLSASKCFGSRVR